MRLMRASCVAKFQMLSQLEQPSLSLSQLACPLFQHLDHIAATLFTHSATTVQQRTSRTHRKGTAGSISETSSSGSSFVFFSFPRQILAHFGTKPTVLHQSHRSPGKPHYLLHMHGSLRGGSFLSRFPFKIIAFGKLWQQCVFPTSA